MLFSFARAWPSRLHKLVFDNIQTRVSTIPKVHDFRGMLRYDCDLSLMQLFLA